MFLVLALAVWVHPAPFAIDTAARGALNGWHRRAMDVVTRLGSIAVLLPVVAVVGLIALTFRRDVRGALFLVLSLAGAVVLYDIVKALEARPRPPGGADLAGYSFPSGHTVAATAVWGALSFLLARGAGPWGRRTIFATGALIVVAVGITRIALDAHWASDVAGGFALGGTWLGVVTLAVWRPPAPEPPVETTSGAAEAAPLEPLPSNPATAGSRRR
jgi:undecaprenyl-diphosphatase